jgi:hypothetical protein
MYRLLHDQASPLHEPVLAQLPTQFTGGQVSWLMQGVLALVVVMLVPGHVPPYSAIEYKKSLSGSTPAPPPHDPVV